MVSFHSYSLVRFENVKHDDNVRRPDENFLLNFLICLNFINIEKVLISAATGWLAGGFACSAASVNYTSKRFQQRTASRRFRVTVWLFAFKSIWIWHVRWLGPRMGRGVWECTNANGAK